DQHPWFQRARLAKPGSAARNYYVWSNTNQTYEGTRIIFIDSEKSNWTWDPVANAYFWHRFYSHQPDLNFDNPLVLRAVLGVMRFWLDLGVDGLRLDAVPYLVEREGTSNENLPETHAILKRIRAHLDASYSGRLLLAEANQWPEDAQEYFGQGDECHMSFHFPLMPRMYMAIAKEDRFPIVDIMRQTPDIPANCQWAIFLRNHDELTLEMVTSAERDYLWETYAADRRARLNLGIRRRLAPLLERDRRRIELMNGLLFSMPGTPVLYYGDEIGMGDNIHLGDRDGVRTPMQWSPDRNGGFSRADPEKLVLPALNSPLYGYESVNVETQRRDPHSLLNWTRRMLTLRSQYKAFGRGRMRFLFPGNRKILAYLREHDGEIILCVANLSRAPQAVELDLSEFIGRVPVEMLGGTSFPGIGQAKYLLTFPPYGFYWFLLSTTAQPPTWHTAAPDQMQEYVTLVVHSRLRNELTEASRDVLQREVLPNYLARRRWFAGKGMTIRHAHISYVAALPTPDLFLTEVEVESSKGDGQETRTERYMLPIGVLWDQETLPALPQQLAFARLRRANRVGFLTDAFSLAPFVHAMLQALRERSILSANNSGEIHFLAEDVDDVLDVPPDVDITWLSAEQSNSSLVIGGKSVLKIIRRVVSGVHPETEMTRHLSHLGFNNIAGLLGEVVRVAPDGTLNTIAVLQRYIGNQGDGWTWTLDYLRRTIDEASSTTTAAAPADTTVTEEDDYEDELRAYASFAAVVGRRLAELHANLSLPSTDPAFAPMRVTSDDVADWGAAAQVQLNLALDILQQTQGLMADIPVDAQTQALAHDILDRRQDLLAAIRTAAAKGVGALRTRVHGDFHLGQVLVVQGDAYIVDFEGEPSKSLEKRREKSSPLRDVAGMLRSFDYAVSVASDPQREGGVQPLAATQAQRTALMQRFRDNAETAFLNAYREVARNTLHPWASAEAEDALLDLFLLEKATYEICYEAANRPVWINLPIRGLHALAERLSPRTHSSGADAP
ncbi:MAG: treS, partial [Rhodocyclales bacterium]|nr:treS [Rhodocyclales bacterium]